MSLTEPQNIRNFGIVALAVGSVMVGLGIWREKAILVPFFSLIAVAGTGLALAPRRLRPVYDAWLRMAHILNRWVIGSILLLMWCVIITPAAWLKAICGGRPLPLKPDPGAESYWISRPEGAQPKERFYKRY